MDKIRFSCTVLALSAFLPGLSLLPAYGSGAESPAGNITATAVTSAESVTMPSSVFVSPDTGGISNKQRWSLGANIAYSNYSIDNANLTNDINRQSGSIGYLGIFARYGITEDLMISGELDYLYGKIDGNISGTTIDNSYSGFPVSVNLLLYVPMNDFSIYAGVGPVYLAGLQIKQTLGGSTNTGSGFGAGAQGIIGMETYLSSHSSLDLELRYRHISLYKNNGGFIAPLNGMSMGIGMIFYL